MNWQLFLSVFGIIFIAELPDKTALATLLLAARSRGSAVFLGVAAAFLIQTIVAALFGNLLSLFPPKWIHIGAGLLFIGFAVHMWWTQDQDEDDEAVESCEIGYWISARNAFLVIFIAEWGDLTQIATASLIGKYHHDQLTVFVAALLALWAVTGIAVVAGQHIHRLIEPALVKRFGMILFFIIGIYFILTAGV